jgi:hypothetical protein
VDRRVVRVALVAPERNVVACRQRVADEVLEDDGDLAAQRRAVGARGVEPMEHDAAALGQVQAREELGERGLARAVRAHEGDDLARLDPRRHPLQRRLGAGIREPDLLGADRADRRRSRARLGGVGRARREGDEGEVVLDEHRGLEERLGAEAAVGEALAEQDHGPGRRGGGRQRDAPAEREARSSASVAPITADVASPASRAHMSWRRVTASSSAMRSS